MAHSCPDGTHTKLVRTGPVGTLEGVTFTCPRCGFTETALEMQTGFERIRPLIVRALTNKS